MLRKILGADLFDSSAILSRLPKDNDKPGCYIIWHRNRRTRPLYVGMANQWLLGRLRNHIARGQTSFRNYVADQILGKGDVRKKPAMRKKQIYEDVNGWVRINCRFQYMLLRRQDEAELLEKFATAVLEPLLQYPTR